MTASDQDIEIAALGARGDGIADTPRGQVYVPFALPGESWRAADGGGYVLQRGHAERAKPCCAHFGTCGGCVAQHMPDALYAQWKRGIVVDAFHHRGIDAPVAELIRVPPASRRHINVYARRYAGGVRLGFHRGASHEIMDVRECPIAMPQLVSALPALRELLEPLLFGHASEAVASIDIYATTSGLDVQMDFTRVDVSGRDLSRMAATAARLGFARLVVAGETIAMARPPAFQFGGVEVELPRRPFVQAVQASEDDMVRLALAATAKAKRVADLFCGLGTFTFPMARHARVLAVDESKTAIASLEAGVRRAQGLKPIETKVRDLFRMPLATRELEGFDAVVLDPARSGAQAQCAQLARSRVGKVVAVSCNPGTLARDVRILLDGGYHLESVTPIDQFLFAAHVEAVAILRR